MDEQDKPGPPENEPDPAEAAARMAEEIDEQLADQDARDPPREKPKLRSIPGGKAGASRASKKTASSGSGAQKPPPQWAPPTPPKIRLPGPDDPITILGSRAGMIYLLDSRGQLVIHPLDRLTRPHIIDWFGEAGREALYRLWPKYGKQGEDGVAQVEDLNTSLAQESIIVAASREIYSVEDRVRGPGGWRADDGRLIFNCGTALHVSSGKPPAHRVVGDHVYPASARTLEPAGDRLAQSGAGMEIFEDLQTWNWRRGFDARLGLGWAVCAVMGAANRVHPNVWISGGHGTGKSTFNGENGYIDRLLDGFVRTSADPTAAYIAQTAAFGCQPVLLDEAEPDPNSPVMANMIRLARIAYSGSKRGRGGQDGTPQETRLSMSLMFSSIVRPPLNAEDVSRIAALHLNPLPPDARPPDMSAARLRGLGQALMAHVLAQWETWPKRVEIWREGLKALGHNDRSADTFGYLLAGADLALSTTLPHPEDVAAIVADLHPETLIEAQRSENNPRACFQQLMEFTTEYRNSGQGVQIGELVRIALELLDEAEDKERTMESGTAQKILMRYGVMAGRVFEKTEKGWKVEARHRAPRNRRVDGVETAGLDVLAVAANGAAILKPFFGTKWQGAPGAQSQPHAQALEEIEGATATGRQLVRIGETVSRAILIPVEVVRAIFVDAGG